jgi:hypothetical protein
MSESEFSDDSTFGLDQVLGAIRRDLKAAQKASESDPLGLFVQSVDVELAFTVESSRQGGGGINLKVFGVGADGERKRSVSSETVHRIQLTLSPELDEEETAPATTRKPAKRPVAKRPRVAKPKRSGKVRRPGIR